jgi:chromosome segregation ATPase
MSDLSSSIKETDNKISSIHKRMAELRSQFTILETELIGLKISKERMEEELRQLNLNKGLENE